jgi:muramoyltetrapeptide carboxypeptidase
MEQKSIRKPVRLLPGDRIAVVAPSQSGTATAVDRAKETVRAMGLTPIVYDSCLDREGGGVPTISQRAGDINSAFADKSILGIIALRAGSGALDVLEYLDFNLIGSNPKMFIGFSDVTAVHLAIDRLCSFVTFHGPLATSSILRKSAQGTVIDEYTADYLGRSIFQARPLGALANPKGEDLVCLSPGVARGRLVGGNLTLVTKTLGTKYEVDTAGRIVLLEDFGESLHAIRAMLSRLADAGKFRDCSGVLLGAWTRCGDEVADPKDRFRLLRELFCEVLVPFGKPILSNLRAGHCVPMITLPLGIDVELNADALALRYTESATQEGRL